MINNLKNLILGVYTNRIDYIGQLLNSIQEFNFKVPIIVQIENGSVGYNMCKLREYFLNQNKRFWVFLDDDITFLNELILRKALLDMLSNNMAVTGVYQTFSDSVCVEYKNGILNEKLKFKYTDWVPGYFMMVDSEKIKDVEIDTSIPGNTGFDLDYCLNVKNLGFNIGLSPSLVKHVYCKYGNVTPFNARESNEFIAKKWGNLFTKTNMFIDNTIN